jgi:4-hydroxybenzoate polyprenyltransferase
MSWNRFQAFIDLSRIHGTPIIIGVFLVGIISGINVTSLNNYIISIIILFFFKTSGAVLNDITDFDMDSLDPVLQNKPIQTGLITKREAWIYFILCFISGLSLSILFLSFLTTLLLIVILGVSVTYSIWGKFVPVTFEVLFPISMGALVIAGSFVSGGPTQLTLLLSVIVLTAFIFGQWINSIRDVEIDIVAKVGSIASLDFFNPNNPRKKTCVTFIAGYIIWCMSTVALLMPFFFSVVQFFYLPFVILTHSIITFLIFRWVFVANSRRDFNKILVFDVVSCWFPVLLLIMDKGGWVLSFGFLSFIVIGTFVAISIEKASQYKIAIIYNKSNSLVKTYEDIK